MGLMKNKGYTPETDIRINPMLSSVLPGQVDGTGISVNSDYRKIIKAGTPVGGDTNFLQDRSAVLSASSTATAQGILLHDIDVTDGAVSADIMFTGVVDELKIKKSLGNTDYATYITSAVKGALKGITFVKGRDE